MSTFIKEFDDDADDDDIRLWQVTLFDTYTSPPPQQPGVVYVVQGDDTGQVILPPASAEDSKKTFMPQIIFACVVFWLCGFLFGLIALILARK